MARLGRVKNHVQQELLNKAGTGRARKHRKGSRPVGRPRKRGRRWVPHIVRPDVAARNPLHVTLRVRPEIGNLRKAKLYKALRHATYVTAGYEGMRIVHISIQREHIHLLVEVEGKNALSRGMQGFKISAAKQINRVLGGKVVEATECHGSDTEAAGESRGVGAPMRPANGGERKRRRGSVFADRYHAEIITTPRRARHALAYVLNNWRKHGEDRGRSYNTDPYSTGCLFTGWKAFTGKSLMWQVPEGYHPLIVWLPQTWLLREGWKRYGPIGFHELPSARQLMDHA